MGALRPPQVCPLERRNLCSDLGIFRATGVREAVKMDGICSPLENSPPPRSSALLPHLLVVERDDLLDDDRDARLFHRALREGGGWGGMLLPHAGGALGGLLALKHRKRRAVSALVGVLGLERRRRRAVGLVRGCLELGRGTQPRWFEQVGRVTVGVC